MMIMKQLISLFIGLTLLLAASLPGYSCSLPSQAAQKSRSRNNRKPPRALSRSDEILARAYEQRLSNIQVEGQGVVQRLLSDDNDGSRHQRFILELASGHTLLISHNIDLAPRVAGLLKGDAVSFYGEYDWNEKGGVIHWTHHDPRKRHPAGWIKHDGRIYQ